MSQIFGGSQSKQSSSSGNFAYPGLQTQLNPVINNGAGASNQLSNMLGLNGNAGQSQAFKNWQDSTGYQFGLNQGEQSINGNAATQGLLNSGATGKALQTYGQNYADTKYGDYTNQLQGLLGSGLQGAGVLAGAGQHSSSSASSSQNTGGIGSAIGSLLAK